MKTSLAMLLGRAPGEHFDWYYQKNSLLLQNTQGKGSNPAITDLSGRLTTSAIFGTVNVHGAGTISTFAGTGTAGSTGDGGAATSATLNAPFGAALDSAGNLYIVDLSANKVRKITPGGVISTFAGTGTAGSTGDGGAATSATLNGPTAVAVDSSNNVYITEDGGNRVRKVTPGGTISRFCGTGTAGSTGDGGAATSATINRPAGVAVDSSGNVYVGELAGHRVRKVTPGGTISTIAGTGTAGSTGDGGAATSATLNGPTNVATDGAGNVFICEETGKRVRKVNVGGTISTLVGNGTASSTGDGGPAASAKTNVPRGIATDSAGNVYITETSGHRLRKITAAGAISTLAGTGTASSTGDGGAAILATLNSPMAVAVDANGHVYVAEKDGHKVRKISGTPSAGPWSLGGFAIPRQANVPARIEFQQTAQLDLLSGSAWSVEFKYRPAAIGRTQRLWSLAGTATAWNTTTGLHALLYMGGTGLLEFRVATAGATLNVVSGVALTAATDYYIKCSADGSKLTLRIGDNVYTTTYAAAGVAPQRPTGNPTFCIGSLPTNTTSDDYHPEGSFWAWRVTQGVARPDRRGYRQLPFYVPLAMPGSVGPADPVGTTPGDPPTPPPIASEAIITADGGTWTVPVGVTSICIVCIGMRAHISGTTLVQAQRGSMVGTGNSGGDTAGETITSNRVYKSGASWGGSGETPYVEYIYYARSGGGGAGGYTAAGTAGTSSGPTNTPTAGSGAGRGGEGGTGGTNPGGGASLFGVSPGGGTLYGGGIGGSGYTDIYNSETNILLQSGTPAMAEPGRSLAWANDIAVTPGDVITFVKTTGGGEPAGTTTFAARVLYGAGKSFPNNAG